MNSEQHVCPVWVGQLMVSRLRNLVQNPIDILSPYIKSGMKVLEIGPALGFFSIPMAKMVNPTGKIYCVDIQKKMLEKLETRAKKYKVNNQIELIESTNTSFNIAHLEKQIDFTLLFAVVHEVRDQSLLFNEVSHTMKKGARVLISEPKGHVKEKDLEWSIQLAAKSGLVVTNRPKINGSRSVELQKI